MIIVNLKNYKKGKDVVKFVKYIESVDRKIITCAPTMYLEDCVRENRNHVFAQNVGYVESLDSTGRITVDSLKKKGVVGSLINHPEYKMDFYSIEKLLKENKNYKFVVCASSLSEVKKIMKLKPYAICYMNPKLRSDRKDFVINDDDKLIKFSELLNKKNILALCGSGVRSVYDYRKILDLGLDGIVLSFSILGKNFKNILDRFVEEKRTISNFLW